MKNRESNEVKTTLVGLGWIFRRLDSFGIKAVNVRRRIEELAKR